MIVFSSKKIKCEKCRKDISIKSFHVWIGRKINGKYYCTYCNIMRHRPVIIVVK